VTTDSPAGRLTATSGDGWRLQAAVMNRTIWRNRMLGLTGLVGVGALALAACSSSSSTTSTSPSPSAKVPLVVYSAQG